MKGVYLALIGFSAVIIAVLIFAFNLTGSPFLARGVNLDKARESALGTFTSTINVYYQKNFSLPQSLRDAMKSYVGYYSSSGTFPKDPESGEDYDYKIISSTGYQLCAIFSTDSEEIRSKNIGNSYPYGSGQYLHKKGYDCLAFEIPAGYIKVQYPVATTTVSATTTGSVVPAR